MNLSDNAARIKHVENSIAPGCVRTFVFILSLVVFLMVFSSSVSATTYYVRTDGSDGNNGLSNSSGGAWATVGKCTSNLTAGDICRVQSGTYNEGNDISNSGTPGNYIEFKGDVALN